MPADVVWTLDGDESSWAEWASARATAAASPLVRELIAAQPPAAGGWALDLGSGTGRAFAPLVEAGYRVVGVDPTAQAVAASRERADREGLPAWSLQASAARLPLTAGAIPFLFAVGTLYHLSPRELAAALGEVWRVLQPSGQAVLHFLDIDDWRSRLAPRIEAGEAPVPAYRAVVTCFASPRAIRRWIETSGLEVVSLDLRTSVSEAGEQRNWIATCRRPQKE
jgi:SAM-dependent methyltransferase